MQLFLRVYPFLNSVAFAALGTSKNGFEDPSNPDDPSSPSLSCLPLLIKPPHSSPSSSLKHLFES